jgi:uncharacterized protein
VSARDFMPERAALAVRYQSATKSATERFARSSPLARTTGIRYYVPVQYEWDDGKAAENLHKHGVDFADAIAAVEDPNRLEEIDDRFVYGEERVHVIGMAHNKVLFVVVTLPGEDTCRIISTRKATRHEQDRYYAGDRETW